MRLRALFVLLAALFVAWVAPLAGLAALGEPLSPYLDFPPRTHEVAHGAFSWGAFGALSLPACGALALLWLAARRARAPVSSPRGFPWWGWLGLALIAAGWFLAWNGELVPPRLRRQTFTPLWLGYVLVVNALAYRRFGSSLLTHRTAWFLALFPASAVFWWLFEHLNRFVANWHYSGIEASSDWDYFVQATLPFATVLPAIASTWSLLREWPLALAPMRGHAALALLAFFGGSFALAATAIWPEALFPMLWLGPCLLLAGLQQLLLGETLFEPLGRGDWRPLLQPAAAALVCGFFWELWNYGALAKWHYSIPYVQRFQIFEMPLLGYAGYLPFGVTCALVMDVMARLVERRRLY